MTAFSEWMNQMMNHMIGGAYMNREKENPRCGNSADKEKIEESMVISVDGETVAQAVQLTIRDNREA